MRKPILKTTGYVVKLGYSKYLQFVDKNYTQYNIVTGNVVATRFKNKSSAEKVAKVYSAGIELSSLAD